MAFQAEAWHRDEVWRQQLKFENDKEFVGVDKNTLVLSCLDKVSDVFLVYFRFGICADLERK